jgi:hypothetical protein
MVRLIEYYNSLRRVHYVNIVVTIDKCMVMLDTSTKYVKYTHPHSVVYDPSNCLGSTSRLGIVQVAAALIV